MEGDFRRPPQRPVNPMGGRPLPQSSYRPPVTDLRPQTQQPAAEQPQPQTISQPASFQPAAVPAPTPPVQVQPQPAPPPQTTAELIARHERETKPKRGGRRDLILAAAGLIVIVAAVFLLSHHSPAKANGPLSASVSASQMTIPVFYPKNLPSGFKITGYKVVQQNVLNYVVTNSNNDSFYVNIQAVPAGYDFTAFNKRFTAPVSYATAIGSATAGQMNNQLVCSIVSGKSWVMINTAALKSGADMATIAKSLRPVTL